MHAAEVLALAYQYPHPNAFTDLSAAVDTLGSGTVQHDLKKFLKEIGRIDLAKWEELHTATLDLSPMFVPYVGHVVWGENYRRGEFMADLNGEMRDAAVSLDGELPDHIAPVLRYMARHEDPFADLVEVLPRAVESMRETLSGASPGNPYIHLLEATVAYCADLRPLTIGRGT
jgi:nitrate reductase delta subunit